MASVHKYTLSTLNLNIPVKSCIASEIQASNSRHNDRADNVSWQRHVERLVNLGKPLGSRHSIISGERPTQTALPRVGSDQAADSGTDDERFQYNGSGSIIESAVKQCQDRNTSFAVRDILEVADNAEEHRDGVTPTSDKSNGYSSHDGDWDHTLWPVDFLCQMSCTVKTAKSPIGIH